MINQYPSIIEGDYIDGYPGYMWTCAWCEGRFAELDIYELVEYIDGHIDVHVANLRLLLDKTERWG